MKLFAKAKAGPGVPAPVPETQFHPIDRGGLLGLLGQVVNGGQSGTLQLTEPRGMWTYGFQGGALTHASGGRVRGARQAFDLIWEFQQGGFLYVPGVNADLRSNLYIDKGRLLDLLQRSQAVLQSPASPYIPPDQQRPVAPVNPQLYTPRPAAAPAWQPPPQSQPQQPGPAWGSPPQGPAGYPAGYPNPPYPPPGAMPPQAMPAPWPPQPAQPPYPTAAPTVFMQPQPVPAPVAPAPAPPVRPVTPQSFSVPPMAIPKRREPSYEPPAATLPAAPPAAEPKPAMPQDDLKALRDSLVAQGPAPGSTPPAPNWGVRQADGSVVMPAPVASRSQGNGKQKKGSWLSKPVRVQMIKFLLWACERKYSPDEHWTLKDAFEVSTMELREQFVGAFSQSFKSKSAPRPDGDDFDDVGEGQMRGRARGRKR